MREKELIDTIKTLTVQIVTEREKGTGVLIEYDGKPHILTVFHVIYGKNQTPHQVDMAEIKFIFSNKAEVFPIAIIPFKHLVLLEIEHQYLPLANFTKATLSTVEYGEDYYIRGFPKGLTTPHNFRAKCNDDTIDKRTFKIEISDITNDTSGDDAIEYMRGVSGSGVFCLKDKKLHLVGLVNALNNSSATFNAVLCTNFSELKITPKKKRKSFNFYWLIAPVVPLILYFTLQNQENKAPIIQKIKEPTVQKTSTSKKIFISIEKGKFKDMIEASFSRKLRKSGFQVNKNLLTEGYRINIINSFKQEKNEVSGMSVLKTDCRLSYEIIELGSGNVVLNDFKEKSLAIAPIEQCFKGILDEIHLEIKL